MVDVVSEGRVEVSAEEAHHLVRVRRVTPGALFLGLDGRGRVFLCRLRADGSSWYGEVVEERSLTTESPVRIVLGQAMLKRERFEWVLQKSTELGVFRVVPLTTVRTEPRLIGKKEPRRLERWRKILVEAVKQSGRTRVPELASPSGLKGCLEANDSELRFALDEEAPSILSETLHDLPETESCLVLVGPEGGWDETERRLLEEHGVRRIGLGPRTLRAETAPIAILAILQFLLGDLGE